MTETEPLLPLHREVLVATAQHIATVAHRGDSYGHRPFIDHPAHVVEVLKRFRINSPQLQAAGWLHDVVEDTDFPLDEIRRLFGDDVADMVDVLTDVSGPQYPNRKARKTATIERIMGNYPARIVKTADRIANVEACWADPEHRLMGMYRGEHAEFRQLYAYGILTSEHYILHHMGVYLDILMKWHDDEHC